MAELNPPAPQPPDTPTPDSSSSRKRRRTVVSERARTGGTQREPRSAREFTVSVAVHVLVGVAFLQFLTFGHGWSRFLGFGKQNEPREERVTFVATREPKPPVVAKTPPKVRETPTTDASRLRAPTTGPVVGTPAAQPEPVASKPDTGSAPAPGTGAKGVGALDPNLQGVKPGYTDVRVWRGTGGGGAASAGVASGRDRAEKLDSIMRFAITAGADELDSAARANGTAGRKPGDWTKTDANGNKWGWDGTGIRLGKVTIPNALLGLLPLNAQRGMSGNYTDMQRDSRLALAREDIMRNVDRTLGEAEFKKLVNELRDRRERERRDRLRAPDPTIVVSKPITPDK
jgi:hypothetical protein